MPWGFTAVGSLSLNVLIFFGVFIGIIRGFLGSIRLVFQKRKFEVRSFLFLFIALGILCLASQFSYSDDLRKSLDLDDSLSSSFNYISSDVAEVPNTNEDFYHGGYRFPSIDSLNRRILGLRINVGLVLLTMMLSVAIVIRKHFMKQTKDDSYDTRLVLFGITGALITGMHISLWY